MVLLPSTQSTPRIGERSGLGSGRAGRTPGRSGPGARTGAGAGGLGRVAKGIAQRRHRKVLKDTIQSISKGDIRRLARRGGVKRISAAIYEDVRGCMRSRLEAILRDVCIFLDHANRQTVLVGDVILALKRRGNPIYGFDKGTYNEKRARRK